MLQPSLASILERFQSQPHQLVEALQDVQKAFGYISEDSMRANPAMARTAAIFISSLISVAPTSRAPRKMNGKHRTLLTWLG